MDWSEQTQRRFDDLRQRELADLRAIVQRLAGLSDQE
jgi:hypothetical protein